MKPLRVAFFRAFFAFCKELSNALQNKLQASGLLIRAGECYIEITEEITQKQRQNRENKNRSSENLRRTKK